MIPVVALVGRPNVGKSTLFNRLTRTRDAIVAEFAGLTRDRQYGKGAMGEYRYLVVDTGGLTGDTDGIERPMAEQALTAIGEADLVLFMVDAKGGRTSGDEDIARVLRTGDHKVMLVANKIDGQNPDLVDGEFATLGLGSPVLVSASNGHGVRHLVDDEMAEQLADFIASQEEEDAQDNGDQGIKIAVVGRPNVGKSTLVNRMLGEERVVVYDQAGTTRDSIYVPFERNGERYTLIDTAGIRRRGKVSEKIEKFSIIKTLEAIQDANVVILMIDAREGIVDQDLHLLSHILDAGRALVFAVNKWDGTDLEQKEKVKRELQRRLTFIDFAATHFISALHGSGVGKLYDSIHKAYSSATRKLQTRALNDILAQAVQEHQPPMVNGRRVKLRYAHLGGSNPPIIVIHGNQTEAVQDSYKRYLQHRFMEALQIEGTPIRIEFRTSDNPFKGRKNKLTDRQIKRKKRLIEHVRHSKKVSKRKNKFRN
ncbi:MAG: ribosome biogenesis GTPase Der [Pseudomonadales bacterium]|nr:ribosome biogenesis GTPase Der [Pseudomonadales bacterium]